MISTRATESAMRIEISEDASASPIHSADVSQILSTMMSRSFSARPAPGRRVIESVAAQNGQRKSASLDRSSPTVSFTGRSHQPAQAVSGDSIPIAGKLSAVHGGVNGEAADNSSAVD